MHCRLDRFRLTKAVPLAISRGTTATVEHLLFRLEHDGITGLGETGGFDTGHRRFHADAIAAELEALMPRLQGRQPQPLPPLEDPEADCAAFAALELDCPIPLVADESCWDLRDVVRLAPYVDGINIKLLKSGGLAEALLMARLARRLDLGVMIGCYSDSLLLNGAAAQLLPLVQWPDLDSHLNLIDDPFSGPPLQVDRLLPGAEAGLGVSLPQEPGDAHS